MGSVKWGQSPLASERPSITSRYSHPSKKLKGSEPFRLRTTRPCKPVQPPIKHSGPPYTACPAANPDAQAH